MPFGRPEPVGDDSQRAVGDRARRDAAARRVGRRPLRVGEEHGAVGRDARGRWACCSGVGGRGTLDRCRRARRAAGPTARSAAARARRRSRRSEKSMPAVLGDEEAAVGRERGAVRAAAGVGDRLAATGSRARRARACRPARWCTTSVPLGRARAAAGTRPGPRRTRGPDADDVRSVHRRRSSHRCRVGSATAGTVARDGHDERELPDDASRNPRRAQGERLGVAAGQGRGARQRARAHRARASRSSTA